VTEKQFVDFLTLVAYEYRINGHVLREMRSVTTDYIDYLTRY
jgi:hypothetical protein